MARQTEIPGAERIHYADIEEAADAFVEATEESKRTKEARDSRQDRLSR